MSAAQEQPGVVRGRKVLVIGLSPEVNRSVVAPLQDLGIAAQGSTQPNEASQLFTARDFELIVFGRGILGPTSERLKSAFEDQSPSVRFVNAIHPLAVEQVLAALAHDPRSPRFFRNFQVARDDSEARVGGEILAPCRLKLTLYHLADGDVVPEVLANTDVPTGPFEYRIELNRLRDANSLVASVDGEEYHLYPFL